MTRPRLIQTELDNELFTELLTGTIATRVYYWRATLCPCYAPDGRGGPDPRCPVCGGDGRRFKRPPIVTREERFIGSKPAELRMPPLAITAIALEDGTPVDPTGLTVNRLGTLTWATGTGPAAYQSYRVTYTAREVMRAGITRVKHRREVGDRVVDDADAEMSIARWHEDHSTLNHGWDAVEGDCFELVDVHRREQHHVTRTALAADRLKYARAYDIVLTSIRDGDVHTWELGDDYTIDGPTITWEPGRGPKVGEQYAASYQANPLYTVWRELPQLRHQDAKELPRRFGLKVAETAPKSILGDKALENYVLPTPRVWP